MRVLLGGRIGCGKSFAGRRFREVGAVVVDADKLGHAVIGRGGEAHDAVNRRWPSVVTETGIDRGALGRIVFASDEQLRELEAIVHPEIITRIISIADDAADLVVEIPLILEIPGDWTTVYVDAATSLCIRRAVARGLDEGSVLRRMSKQPHRHEWLEWADRMLENNGTPDELAEGVDKLWTELRA